MIAKATNTITGEVFEFEVRNLPDLITAYSAAGEYEKMAKRIKDQLKGELDKYLDEHGRSPEVDGKQFKRISIQKMTYDKAILRNILDEDTYDLFMKPEKIKIDKWIAENLESLGEDSTTLRKNMVPDGARYDMVKLEKLERDQ